MIRAGGFALVLLAAVGGTACRKRTLPPEVSDGGVDVVSGPGAAGAGGIGGQAGSVGGAAGTGAAGGASGLGGSVGGGGTAGAAVDPDGGIDSDAAPNDAAPEGGPSDAPVDQGGPVSCTGTPLPGGMPLPSTGEYPNALVLSDLDRDGKLDVVTVNHDSDTVSVLLGTGNGRFLARADYATGSRPNALAVGDLDGDGFPDVVVGDRLPSGGVVSVLRGIGQGKLAAKQDYTLGSFPWALALGDLNGDGKLDVAVVDQSQAVNVLLNLGDGRLGAKVSYSVSGNPTAVAIADMHGDGKLDLVLTGWSGTVSVYAGNGDGTFVDRVEYASGGLHIALAVGDLDGTAGLDAVTVTANVSPDTVAVLLSTSDRKLVRSAAYPVGGHVQYDNPYMYPGRVGNSPASLVIADLNADGKQDVIEANNTSGTVSVLLGTGGGTFAAAVDYATGGSPVSLAAGDLNGDGKLDLAIANGDADEVRVLVGKGDGTFGGADAARVDTPVGGAAIQAGALGDMNGDGKLDLVVASGSNAIVLRGLGDGHFAVGATYPGVAAIIGLALADLNGDGLLDLVAANGISKSSVSVWLAPRAGELSGRLDYPTGSGPGGLALADLNMDGRPDIVTTDMSAASASVLLNTGDGKFGQAVGYTTDLYPSGVAIGDLNGDGKLDVVTSNSNTASVLLGIGDGRLAGRVDHHRISSSGATVGDVTADGKLDIVGAGSYFGASVLAGNGDGTFAAETFYAVGPDVVGVILADVTADGRPDILVAGGKANTVIVLPSAPDGIGATKLVYETGAGVDVRWLAAGDLDGDGRVDLVFPAFGNQVGVILNTCP